MEISPEPLEDGSGRLGLFPLVICQPLPRRQEALEPSPCWARGSADIWGSYFLFSNPGKLRALGINTAQHLGNLAWAQNPPGRVLGLCGDTWFVGGNSLEWARTQLLPLKGLRGWSPLATAHFYKLS